MSSKMKFLCGVPHEHCCGGKLATDQTFQARKCHSSRVDAFKCMRRYMISQGYEPIGQRTFKAPNGGPIRILPKKSKFGGRLRTGKEGTRYMPDSKDGQCNHGIIF